MKTILLLLGVIQVLVSTGHAAGAVATNSPSRMNKEQILAILPKSIGAYQQIDLYTYQPMADYNRLSRVYKDNTNSLNVEVRDTGGFTPKFVKSNFYLRGEVGEKQFGHEILLLEGSRAQMYPDAFDKTEKGKIVKIAWRDRYEIMITGEEEYDTLKKFAFIVAAQLK